MWGNYVRACSAKGIGVNHLIDGKDVRNGVGRDFKVA